MKMKRKILSVILMAMVFSVTSCNSGKVLSENRIESVTDTINATETVKVTEAKISSVTEAVTEPKPDEPEYIKEIIPLPEDMHNVSGIEMWKNGLFLNGIKRYTDIDFSISISGKDDQKNEVLVSVPGPDDNTTVFINAVFSEGDYLYAAGTASAYSFSNGGFIFRYSISENEIQNIKYFDDTDVRDMAYDGNKEEILLLTYDNEVVSVDMNFEIREKIRPQDQLPSDTDLNLNTEYIAVDSFSNIYLSCGKRLSDYNTYDVVHFLVLDPDYSYKSISEIRPSSENSFISEYGVSRLSDGSAGLFYKADDALYVRRAVNGGTETEDILLIDDGLNGADISCGRSTSDYVVRRRYSDNRKGYSIELRNIENDSPETVIDRPGSVFSPNSKGLNFLANSYLSGDTMFSVNVKTNSGITGSIYECTDFSGEVINSVVQEEIEMSAFSVTDSGSILYAERSDDDGIVIRKKTETGTSDLFEIDDFKYYNVREIFESCEKYIVVFKSNWYDTLYDDKKTLIRIYSDKGEILGEADFTSLISIVTLDVDSGMPDMLAEDNGNIYRLRFDTEKKIYDISECREITELFRSFGLFGKEDNSLISQRSGGKYDAYIKKQGSYSEYSVSEAIYGYNALENTLTKLVDKSVLKNDDCRNICVSESGDIFFLVYHQYENKGEIQVLRPAGTAADK